MGRGNGLVVESWPRNPEVRGFDSSSRQSLISIEHAELLQLPRWCRAVPG